MPAGSAFNRVVTPLLIALAGLFLTSCDQNDTNRSEFGIYRIITLPDLGTGTGFLVNDGNLVVTNRHVVFRDGGGGKRVPVNSVLIATLNERNQPVFTTAEIIKGGAGTYEDLALLRPAKPLPGKPVRIGNYVPSNNAEVRAIGFPAAADIAMKQKVSDTVNAEVRGRTFKSQAEQASFAQELYIKELVRHLETNPTLYVPTNTTGVVSRVTPYEDVPVIQHQAPINPGNSGGPLFDSCGAVVGVNTFLPAIQSQGIFMSLGSVWLIGQIRGGGQSIATTSGLCLTAQVQNYVPVALGGTAFISVAAMLSTMLMLFVFRRTPAVRRGYTVLTRMTGRAPKAPATTYAPTSPKPAAPAGTAMAPAAGRTTAAAAEGALRLVPVAGGAAITIALDRLSAGRSAVLGREVGNDLVLEQKTVSKRHARLTLDKADRLTVEDLGSANGTWKGNSKVARETFSSGDMVRFGSVEFRIELSGQPKSAAAWVPPAPAPTELESSRAYGTTRPPGERPLLLSGMDDNGHPVQFQLRPQPGSAETIWRIGRKEGLVDFVIPHKSVSSDHARIRIQPGRPVEISDVGSSNGTTVDGRDIGRDYVSLDGARKIVFGTFVMNVNRG